MLNISSSYKNGFFPLQHHIIPHTLTRVTNDKPYAQIKRTGGLPIALKILAPASKTATVLSPEALLVKTHAQGEHQGLATKAKSLLAKSLHCSVSRLLLLHSASAPVIHSPVYTATHNDHNNQFPKDQSILSGYRGEFGLPHTEQGSTSSPTTEETALTTGLVQKAASLPFMPQNQ